MKKQSTKGREGGESSNSSGVGQHTSNSLSLPIRTSSLSSLNLLQNPSQSIIIPSSRDLSSDSKAAPIVASHFVDHVNKNDFVSSHIIAHVSSVASPSVGQATIAQGHPQLDSGSPARCSSLLGLSSMSQSNRIEIGTVNRCTCSVLVPISQAGTVHEGARGGSARFGFREDSTGGDE